MGDQVRNNRVARVAAYAPPVPSAFVVPRLVAQRQAQGARAYIYLAFPNEPRLAFLAQQFTDALHESGLPGEMQKPAHFHCTLLYLDAATDQQLEGLFETVSLPLSFRPEASKPSLLSQSLVLTVEADPALLRVQRELSTAAKRCGCRADPEGFSKPENYHPHISLVNDVPLDLDVAAFAKAVVPAGLLPLSLLATTIVLGREEYDQVRTVTLPSVAGDRLLVFSSGGPWAWPVKISKPQPQPIERGDLAALVRGEVVLARGSRRMLGLDRPYALRGGPGSGNFGHEGRPGEVGGSAPGEGGGAIGDWPKTRPWQATQAEVEAGKVPGLRYDSKMSGGITAHAYEYPTVTVGPLFFEAEPTSRQLVLYHEVGHAVARPLLKSGDFVNLLEPFRLDQDKPVSVHSTYDNFVGSSNRPEEMLADVYADLIAGGREHWESEKYTSVYDAVAQAADEARVPSRAIYRYHNGELVLRGGPGSGHHGHEGRPGEVGGSAPGEGGGSPKDLSPRFSPDEAHRLRREFADQFVRINPRTHQVDNDGGLKTSAPLREWLRGRSDFDSIRVGKWNWLESEEATPGWLIFEKDGGTVAVTLRDDLQEGLVIGNIEARPQRSGMGTDVMRALADYAGMRGTTLTAYKVANPGFFNSFTGWNETGVIYTRQQPEAYKIDEADRRAWDAVEGRLQSLESRGGPGSGHYGHEGRPGEVGGSAAGGGASAAGYESKLLEGWGESEDITKGIWIGPSGKALAPNGDHQDTAHHLLYGSLMADSPRAAWDEGAGLKATQAVINSGLVRYNVSFAKGGGYQLLDFDIPAEKSLVTDEQKSTMAAIATELTRKADGITPTLTIGVGGMNESADPDWGAQEVWHGRRAYDFLGLDPDDLALSVFKSGVLRRIVKRGGPGSGNFGHEGRPGEVGGSAPGGGSMAGISPSLAQSQVANELPAIRDKVDAILRERKANHIRGVYPPGESPSHLGYGDYWILRDGTVIDVDSHDRSAQSAFEQPGVFSAAFKQFLGVEPEADVSDMQLSHEGMMLGLGFVRWSTSGTQGVSTGGAKMSDEQAGRVSEMTGKIPALLATLPWEAWDITLQGHPWSAQVTLDLAHGPHGNGLESLLRTRSFIGRGGPGSGHFGHEGRPGEVGGSAPGDQQEWSKRVSENLAAAGRKPLSFASAPRRFFLNPQGDLFEVHGSHNEFGIKAFGRSMTEAARDLDVARYSGYREEEQNGETAMMAAGWIRGIYSKQQGFSLSFIEAPTRSQKEAVADLYISENAKALLWEDVASAESGDEHRWERVYGALRSLASRGGPGSGHFGHEGRPGEVGGSAPGEGGGGGTQQEARDFQNDQAGAHAWARTNLPLPHLTQKQLDSLHYYKETGYQATNAFLRDSPTLGLLKKDPRFLADQDRAVKQIDEAMARSQLPEDLVLYRGAAFSDVAALEVGAEFVDRAYVSTSLASGDARSFAMKGERGERALVRIEVSAGQHAIYMEHEDIKWDSNLAEEEVLLPRDTTFHIVEVKVPVAGLPIVTLRVVP